MPARIAAHAARRSHNVVDCSQSRLQKNCFSGPLPKTLACRLRASLHPGEGNSFLRGAPLGRGGRATGHISSCSSAHLALRIICFSVLALWPSSVAASSAAVPSACHCRSGDSLLASVAVYLWGFLRGCLSSHDLVTVAKELLPQKVLTARSSDLRVAWERGLAKNKE